MRVPDEVRIELRQSLWAIADGLDWNRLSWNDKSAQYEAWTRSPDVGGRLSHYMDQRRIRVYIKDTIMKGYARARLSDPDIAMRALGLLSSSPLANPVVVESYERPHGRLFADGRVIAWGTAKDWKAILMSVHERAFQLPTARPFGAVLSESVGKFSEDRTRRVVSDAAAKLGIEKLVWT